MDAVQAVIGIISDVVLTVTLIVVVIYTIKTADMAKATQDMATATRRSVRTAQNTLREMRTSRDADSAPYVICGFRVDEHIIYFYVKNIGKSIAIDVRLSIQPPLVSPNVSLENTALMTNGISSMPPGYLLESFFGSAIQVYGQPDFPRQFQATITYYGGLEHTQRSTELTLDLAAYEGLYSVARHDRDLVDAIGKLGNGIKDIAQRLEDMSENLDNGIWIRNPSFIMTGSNVGSEPEGRKALAAKLNEFQRLWHAVPRDDDIGVVPFSLSAYPNNPAARKAIRPHAKCRKPR